MTYRSFDKWSNLGYKIIKGSKALWVEDKPVFSDKQVIKSSPPTYHREPYGYNQWYDTSYKEPECETVYYADGSGYLPACGPCGPLYFDRNGNT